MLDVVMPLRKSHLKAIDVPDTGVRGFMRRLRASLLARTNVHVGADVAIETVYQSFFAHYRDGDVMLMHPSDAVLTPRWQHHTRLVHPSHLRTTRPFVLFQPGQISPELIDLRHGYLNRPVPIVFTHHSISYRSQLNNTFMPLVLSPTIDGDSIVCSSFAARGAIDNLLNHVCDATGLSRTRFKGSLNVIPFGVDTGRFKPMDKVVCRKKFKLPSEAFIILAFGRRSAADKADVLPLLYSFRSLVKAIPNAYIVLAGNSRSPQTDPLQLEVSMRGLNERVIEMSNISDDEKISLYNAADVFVSLSDSVQECFGLALIEAMSCGIPQLVSDWNGYRDIVDHGVTGFRIPTLWARCDETIATEGILYPDDFLLDHFRLGQSVVVDPSNLMRHLALLARDRDMRNAMSQHSRERAVSEYSQSVMVERYASLFKDAASRAAAFKGSMNRKDLYRVPEYFRCFSKYASDELLPSTILRVDRCHCQDVLGSGMPYISMFKIDLYRGWDLKRLIDIVASDEMGLCAQDVIAALGDQFNEEDVIRQILWLAKYGCLTYGLPQ